MLLCYAGPVSSEEDSANFVNARFLYQSTFGPTPALIDQVEKVGIESWIKQQQLLPATIIVLSTTLLLAKEHKQIEKMLGIKLFSHQKTSFVSEWHLR